MVRRSVKLWLKPNYLPEISGAKKRKITKSKQHQLHLLRLQAKNIFMKKNTTIGNINEASQTTEERSLIQTTVDVTAVSSQTIKNANQRENFEVAEAKKSKTKELCTSSDTNNDDLELYKEIKLEEGQPINLSDPHCWPAILNDSTRTALLISGPEQTTMVYPSNESGEKFSKIYFTGRKKNGEAFHRDWLMYSKTQNGLYCFPCIMFQSPSNGTPWSEYGSKSTGFNDFHNTIRGIKRHEESENHLANFCSWKAFVYNHKKGLNINAGNEQLLICKAKSWKEILKGILDAILFLAQNNLSFRGSNEKMGEQGCGNFLNLIKLLSNYNSNLSEHVAKLEKGKPSYVSPLIQNEFITLCGNHVREKLLFKIKSRKYYSIMFDATPDISHKEQFSQIIRSVHCSTSGCRIEENFVDFIDSDDKKGEDIANLIKNKLIADNLDLKNCRGQSYDNGSNMSGKYIGVQKWILDSNPLAFFVPCAAHSLNLVGLHAAEKVLPAKLLLGQVQNLYNFFVRSPKRWSLISAKLKCTLKGECKTRGSARADAVSALSQQFEDVIEILTIILSSNDFNSETVADAHSRLIEISTFKFLLGLTVWEHVLFKIQICNHLLQQRNADINDAAKHLKNLLKWLKEFRGTGYKTCFDKAAEKANFVGISLDSGFTNMRTTRNIKRMRLDEKVQDLVLTNDKRFEMEFFNPVLDLLIVEVNSRFTQLRHNVNNFSFLWGKKLSVMDSLDMEKHVKDLCLIYENDFNCSQFIMEAQVLKITISPFFEPDIGFEKIGPLDILDLMHKTGMVDSFVNIDIALRIFLTLPVTVASNERAFSKLKLIKNYLRSSMGQERLTNLSILSIEHEITKEIDFDDIISKFVTTKVRRVKIL